jgi:hypothetical protein
MKLSSRTKAFLQAKRAIVNNSFTIDVQYCRERVTKDALTTSHDSAKTYLKNMSDDELFDMLYEVDERDCTASSLLTLIADANDDCGFFETITPVVIVK